MAVNPRCSQFVGFKPRRLGHANIFVSDLERSMRFYTEVCGLERVFQEPDIRAGFVGNGNTHHDIGMIETTDQALFGKDEQQLVPKGFGRRPGLFHLAFEMEDEATLVDAYHRSVEGAKALKIMATVDHGLARSVYAFDSEGNLLEFYADAVHDWRKFFADSTDKLVTGPWIPGQPAPSRERFYATHPEIRHAVPDAVFSTTRITHAALAVRDFDGELNFYREVAGLVDIQVNRKGADRFAMLRGTSPGFHLVLFPAAEKDSSGLHHLSFEVARESDIVESERRLARFGIQPALQQSSSARQSIVVRDPDGILLEFFIEREPSSSDYLREESKSPVYAL